MNRKHNKINIGLAFFVVALFVVSSSMAAMGRVMTSEVEENDGVADTTVGSTWLIYFILDREGNLDDKKFRAGEIIHFAARGEGANGIDIKFHVDWGDGTGDTSEWLKQQYHPTHAYQENGRYKATCWVEDTNGDTSIKKSIRVKVTVRGKSLCYNPLQFDLLERFPFLEHLLSLTAFQQ